MSWLERAWARIRGVSHEDADEAPRPADAVHFSPDGQPLPLCGARFGAPWALNIAAVTCPRCRELGWAIDVQYWCNTR